MYYSLVRMSVVLFMLDKFIIGYKGKRQGVQLLSIALNSSSKSSENKGVKQWICITEVSTSL